MGNLPLDALGDDMGPCRDAGLGAKEDMPEPLGEGIGTGEPRARKPRALTSPDATKGFVGICAPFVPCGPNES